MRITALALVAAAVGCRAEANTHQPFIFVSNEDSGDITLIDGTTDRVAATIPIGKRPRGLRLSPDGRNLLVAVSGSPKAPPGVDESTLPPPDRSADGIAVVDLTSRELVRILPSGHDPECFDTSSDGSRIYVSNEDAARTSIVDAVTGAITATIAVGEEPEGVTTRPDGAVVYVTSEATNEVTVISAGGEKLATIPTAARPRAVAFTPDGKRAFVTAENGAAVEWIDAERHRSLGRISIPGEGARPMGVVVSPDGRRAYVTNGRGKSVSVIDAENGRVLRTIENVGTRPWGIGVTPDGKKLYTANGPSHDVSVIDAATGEILARIPTGGRSPWGIAIGGRPSLPALAKAKLRVCADPNNLPFSNQLEQGFENALARLVARELDRDLEYAWWAQRRGFIRNTLKAGRCDVVMGLPRDFELARVTRPYYRSTYVLVSKGSAVRSLDDPALRTGRVGVPLVGDDYSNPPPVHALARRGIVNNVVGFTVYGDYGRPNPPLAILEALEKDAIDLAIVWGPLAGYYAKKSSAPLKVAPLPPETDLQFAFEIGMGVRKDDRELFDALERIIERRQDEIDWILASFGVPRP